MATEDKKKHEDHPMPDMMGSKPFHIIGPDRTTEETQKVVSKLKKKKTDGLVAKGSITGGGDTDNVLSTALSHFSNNRQ